MIKWLLILSLYLVGCSDHAKVIKVAASSRPHAEMLEQIKEDFEKEGFKLKILVIDDYHLPNRMLSEKQIDANFFQHAPFLEKEKQDFGYELEAIAKIHCEPLAIYSKKHSSLDVPFKSIVAIPSDPTNEARALMLLQKAGLIKLKEDASFYATTHELLENFQCLRIKEIDAPLLPRILSDVDLAVVPGNFAMTAELDHPLLQEGDETPYVNVLVVRSSDNNREELKRLASLLKSQKIKEYLQAHYQNKICLCDN